MENKTPTQPSTDYPGDWWTVPSESENNPTEIIFVTGRRDTEKFRTNPKFNLRVDVTYAYPQTTNGMPDENTAQILKEVTDRLVKTFHTDPIAILTGIYTGDQQRNWIFYTLSTNIFNRKFNEALSDLPQLPITMTAENDPNWLEYKEMRALLDQ